MLCIEHHHTRRAQGLGGDSSQRKRCRSQCKNKPLHTTPEVPDPKATISGFPALVEVHFWSSQSHGSTFGRLSCTKALLLITSFPIQTLIIARSGSSVNCPEATTKSTAIRWSTNKFLQKEICPVCSYPVTITRAHNTKHKARTTRIKRGIGSGYLSFWSRINKALWQHYRKRTLRLLFFFSDIKNCWSHRFSNEPPPQKKKPFD